MRRAKSFDVHDAARTALRLDPQYIEGGYLNLLGRSLFIAGQYENSIEAYAQNRDQGGHIPTVVGFRNWIAALSLIGQPEAARALTQDMLKYNPGFSLAQIYETSDILCQGELEPLIDGLRKAGVPE